MDLFFAGSAQVYPTTTAGATTRSSPTSEERKKKGGALYSREKKKRDGDHCCYAACIDALPSVQKKKDSFPSMLYPEEKEGPP